MGRFILYTGAAFAAALAAPAAAPAGQATAGREALSAAYQAYEAGDCGKASALVDPIVAKTVTASDDVLSHAYDVAAACAAKAGDNAKAADFAHRAIALDTASDYAWRIAVGIDFDAKRYAAGLDTIDRMLARGRGGTLNTFGPRWFLQIHNALNAAGDNVTDLRLLAIVANRAYDPEDMSFKVFATGDYFRAIYAHQLLAADKRDDARAQIDGLQGYDAMIEIAFDPDLRALNGGPVDFRAVAEADLARHRALIERYPRSLDAINATALDLHRLGRTDEELVLLKAALPRVAASDAFDDTDDKLPWFWNGLAYAYAATGNYDAMVANFDKGAKLTEGGAPNVSQVINLAAQQVGYGHAKDALVTLARLGDGPAASPFGLMQVRLVRGCAYAALGDIDKARTDLAYAVAHEADDPATVT